MPSGPTGRRYEDRRSWSELSPPSRWRLGVQRIAAVTVRRPAAAPNQPNHQRRRLAGGLGGYPGAGSLGLATAGGGRAITGQVGRDPAGLHRQPEAASHQPAPPAEEQRAHPLLPLLGDGEGRRDNHDPEAMYYASWSAVASWVVTRTPHEFRHRRLSNKLATRATRSHAPLAQSAEHIHGKDGVAGSIPAGGSTPTPQVRPGAVPSLSRDSEPATTFARRFARLSWTF